jgi:hypothetical protein
MCSVLKYAFRDKDLESVNGLINSLHFINSSICKYWVIYFLVHNKKKQFWFFLTAPFGGFSISLYRRYVHAEIETTI